MAYVCQLTDGTDTIDLMYNLTAGWTLLNAGIKINRPEAHRVMGGRLQDQLVRSEDGSRVIPLGLAVQGSDGEDLIDRINALEEMLRHAARYRTEGWGNEVFLEFKIDDATHTVRFPVLYGEIDTSGLMQLGREDHDKIEEVPVFLTCEPYWEDDSTYSLENYVENPGFWRDNPAGAVPAAPGESWAEVNGVDVVSTFHSTIFEVMGRSLDMVISPDAANDTGVQSDNITVVAETTYYFECRCYHTSGADDLTARIYDVSNGAVIAASTLTFDNQDDAWEKLGVAFDTPAGCVLARVEILRLAANSSAGDKTYRVDALYLDQRTDAPTGWSSGRTLINHMDEDADHLNVLCVSELPGEVEAEVFYNLDLTQAWDVIYTARRTRTNAHYFQWQWTPCEAYTTAEGGVGGACQPVLTDAACIDSDKIVDANSPSGSRVQVDFATDQDMELRCYWDISPTQDVYNGKYQFIVLASKSADTDTVKMQLETYCDASPWAQGRIITQTVAQAAANEWGLYDGWEIFSFPIGQHDDAEWGAGNSWQVRLYASITGSAAWDNLWIGGLYIIPIDETYAIGGGTTFAAGVDAKLKEMDGDRGLLAIDSGSSTYYSDIGVIGQIPLLEAKVDNYLYFVIRDTNVAIADPLIVSVTYRPRGIFLRGSNP